jgi:hypothetical protein
MSNDGGPAFPLAVDGNKEWHVDGMSLRDYFAGQVVSNIAFPSLTEAFKRGVYRDRAISEISKASYAFADAMLEARKK